MSATLVPRSLTGIDLVRRHRDDHRPARQTTRARATGSGRPRRVRHCLHQAVIATSRAPDLRRVRSEPDGATRRWLRQLRIAARRQRAATPS